MSLQKNTETMVPDAVLPPQTPARIVSTRRIHGRNVSILFNNEELKGYR